MSKIAAFLTSVLMLTTIAHTTAFAAGERVVFINPGKQGEVFWELVTNTMNAAAKQLDFELEVIWADRNKFTMQSIGVSVTERAQKPDFLVLVNEEGAASSILQAAETAGIKTFFLLNSITRQELRSLARGGFTPKHTVGSLEPDMFGAGRRMAETLITAATEAGLQSRDNKLHILALAGDQVTPTSLARTNGFLDYMSTRPDVIVDRLLYSNWNQADASILTARYLDWAKGQQIAPGGVWAANDPIAIGAINAINASGRTSGNETLVVGLNWSSDAIKHIKEGHLLMSDGGHFFGGAWAMIVLRDAIAGCKPKADDMGDLPKVSFTLSSIDKKTDPEFLKILANANFSQIDFATFLTNAKQCGNYDFSASALMRASATTAATR